MGRKPALDEIKRAQICTMISLGCSRRMAARYVGCATSTIAHAAEHNREFREQLRQAELQSEMVPLELLRAHASKSWRAAAWLLERTMPGHYARRSEDMVSFHDIQEHVQQLSAALAAEIPDGEVRQRIARRVQQWREWSLKETRAESKSFLDGRRHHRRTFIESIKSPPPPVPWDMPGDLSETPSDDPLEFSI